MGQFQKQERPWRNALDRAKLLGLVNLGLCPFIYWHNKMPGTAFFTTGVLLLELSAVLFLFNLNLVLQRLGAMLPDETLRQETRQFTALNRWLLVVLLLFVGAYAVLVQVHRPVAAASARCSAGSPAAALAAGVFRAAAAGHDHGADLENQGSHPRQCFWFAPVNLFQKTFHQFFGRNGITSNHF